MKSLDLILITVNDLANSNWPFFYKNLIQPCGSINNRHFRLKARRYGSGPCGPVSHVFESGVAMNCEARRVNIIFINLRTYD
jgi:hypothetical protein